MSADVVRRSCTAFLVALLALGGARAGSTEGTAPAPGGAARALETIERFVPHTSTAPANRGARVGLYLREVRSASLARRIDAGESLAGRVVLFVHGGITPAVPAFDLPHADYSWMAALARAGFDVFAMDFSGYGRSPRPGMDDPCNLAPPDRARLAAAARPGPCEPSRRGPATTRQSDRDELRAVVDHLRALRGVERVSLIGWSLGGPRAGGFAAQHPERVERLFLLSPAYARGGADPPRPPAWPVRLVERSYVDDGRWARQARCDGQVDPAVPPVLWRTLMAFDPLGPVWGEPDGLLRLRGSVATVTDEVRWDRSGAGRVTAPTMIVTGEQENWRSRVQLHADLTNAKGRVLARLECASHYSLWEAGTHRFLHRVSAAWLSDGTFEGRASGAFRVDRGGAVTPWETVGDPGTR